MKDYYQVDGKVVQTVARMVVTKDLHWDSKAVGLLAFAVVALTALEMVKSMAKKMDSIEVAEMDDLKAAVKAAMLAEKSDSVHMAVHSVIMSEIWTASK